MKQPSVEVCNLGTGIHTGTCDTCLMKRYRAALEKIVAIEPDDLGAEAEWGARLEMRGIAKDALEPSK